MLGTEQSTRTTRAPLALTRGTGGSPIPLKLLISSPAWDAQDVCVLCVRGGGPVIGAMFHTLDSGLERRKLAHNWLTETRGERTDCG